MFNARVARCALAAPRPDLDLASADALANGIEGGLADDRGAPMA